MSHHRSSLVGLVCWALIASFGCASVDVVRLQPGMIKVPEGMEPLAGIQAVSMGFYFFTLGIPDADLDKAVNELLLKEAKKLGADQVINLRFDVTPSQGWWFLTKLFWWRVATAYGVAVVKRADAADDPDLPPMDKTPAPPSSRPAPASSSRPAVSRGVGK